MENRCMIVKSKHIPEEWSVRFFCYSSPSDRRECKYFKRKHSLSELCAHGYGNTCQCSEAIDEAKMMIKLEEL